MEAIEFKRYLLGKINEKYTDEEIERIPDEIFHDLYLKKMYAGEILGPMTGNIFLDKPWVQNFLDTPVQKVNVEDTLYNNYVTLNQDNLDEIALFEMQNGHSYTHRELIELINKTATALYKKGIRKNSRIGLFLNNSVEEPVFLLALNKLGAVAKFIDYSKDVHTIKHSVVASNLDLLVMDAAFLPMEQYVNEFGIEVIVVNTKESKLNENYTTFNELLSSSDESIDAVDYEHQKPSIIINSSGTTGVPKPIAHTDYSINNSILKVCYTDFSLDRKNVVMKVIPPQIGLGLITTLITNLYVGTKIALIDCKSPEASIMNTINFVKEFKEFKKINNLDNDAKLIIFGAPMFFRALINDPSVTDLSDIVCMLAAGSKMSKEELVELELKSKEKNCSVKICNGYGQNEMGGAVSLNDNGNNSYGSGGFPTIGTNIRVVDVNNYEELMPMQEGLILERSDSLFLEYEGMEFETKKSKVILSDGLEWFNSQDLGYTNNDGFQNITGRVSRVFIRRDCKFSIDGVEEKIKVHPAVKECGIVPINKGDSDDLIFVFITLNDNYSISGDDIIMELQNSSHSLTDFEIPTAINVIDEMPYLTSGKIDYLKLIELAKEQSLSMNEQKRNLVPNS